MDRKFRQVVPEPELDFIPTQRYHSSEAFFEFVSNAVADEYQQDPSTMLERIEEEFEVPFVYLTF